MSMTGSQRGHAMCTELRVNGLSRGEGTTTRMRLILVMLSTLILTPTHMVAVQFGRAVSEYDYKVVLDPGHKIQFQWSVNYSNDTVSIKLTADTSDVVGFGVGFSDYGEVTNADFAVFWTNDQGVHNFQDAWTDERGVLHPDRSQDMVLTRAKARPGLTRLQFWRRIDTCDSQDYQFDNGTTHLVYFFLRRGSFPSSNVTPYGLNVFLLPHGLQRVQLLKPNIPVPISPPDTWTFTILAPKVTVPAQETTYWWYTTRLPKLSEKHHIIKYEGVIDGGKESLVHHMEVFHCVGEHSEMPFYSGPGQAEGKPPELQSCRKVIGAWAMGAGPIVYPEDAGSPIGGKNFSPYVLLEIHYNNPLEKRGIVDSSGIRFYVTKKLRKHDAGIMELGLEYTDKMALPPGMHHAPLSGYCIQECTQVGIPAEGMKVFASQLHTHLTGKKAYTRHIRGGTELPELNRDNHYSPHFQEIRLLPSHVHVLPGDALITTCVYDTTKRDKATVGGFSITDEMCVNYIHYYPRLDLEVCKSSINTDALRRFFAFMKRMELQPTSTLLDPTSNYRSTEWTPLNKHLLGHTYKNSPISMQCNRSNGQRFPGDWSEMPKTDVLFPLPSPHKNC